MTELQLLQDGPETFRVLAGDGRTRRVLLGHHLRRGLGVTGTPPVAVARELLALLDEHGTVVFDPASFADEDLVDLAPAVGAIPGFVDELRARLS